MRIISHLILPIEKKQEIKFSFNGKILKAHQSEMISSALFANGIRTFGFHPKDKSPQGMFCANGQCAQCSVITDGLPVKSCITPVKSGMKVQSLDKLPSLPAVSGALKSSEVKTETPDVLIIGAGPSGLAAAIELGKLGVKVILADDKDRLGGKLVLQTHKFFGSSSDCYAGTRGIDIAKKLEAEIKKLPTISTWLNSVAVGVFSDKKIGILKNQQYVLVEPKALLVATGARERFLSFKGNTLPGVYGAGAFQTLVNRDLVKPSNRIFIIGGGNVGLIAAYHALQAGIEVAGIVEVLPQVGGYKVHADKIKRLGVPVHLSHTVISANGKSKVESVTIAQVAKDFKPITGTEKTYSADTVLVAVGLTPIDELYIQAKEFDINAFSAGDAQEIAEASAAMFSGKIAGVNIAKSLGKAGARADADWEGKMNVLKSKPGATHESSGDIKEDGIHPVFHCFQEIPCDPCVTACTKKSISLSRDKLTSLPQFDGECTGCSMCVALCPGLAVTVVDYRKDKENPLVSIAFEIHRDMIKKGQKVDVNDVDGKVLGRAEVVQIKDIKARKTLLLVLKTQRLIAHKIAGIKVQREAAPITLCDTRNHPRPTSPIEGEGKEGRIVCRCERVAEENIRKALRSGVRDLNQLKAMTRAGMGACFGRTCEPLIFGICRNEGISLNEVTRATIRPLTMEVPLSKFCNAKRGKI
ncbi:FAD-dependent oxidoreductase [Elusimicrobiota bacterium]